MNTTTTTLRPINSNSNSNNMICCCSCCHCNNNIKYITSTRERDRERGREMIYSFSRLCLVYVLSVWLVTQMGYIHITFTWAHPITSGTYLFALPPIIGYIGGIAVRSSVHILHKQQQPQTPPHHHVPPTPQVEGGNDDQHQHQHPNDIPNIKQLRRQIVTLGRSVECHQSKCMSPEYMFSDQQSISSGIGGAVHGEEMPPHFNGHHLGIFDAKTPHNASAVPFNNQLSTSNNNNHNQEGGGVDSTTTTHTTTTTSTSTTNTPINNTPIDNNGAPLTNINNGVEKSLNYSSTRKLRNVARCAHWNVNERMPKSYYDYENYYFAWQTPDNYEIIRKIGRGKYSEVFLGVHLNNSFQDSKIFNDINIPTTIDNNSKETGDIVIKVLKPIPKLKIQREVKILKSLEGGPNIIPLLDTVKDFESKTKSLVFPFINKTDVRELINYLGDDDLRYYMFELLKAIEFSHSKGIMHRDIKPHNIAIDHSQRKLYLLDWGLAEYYHPYKTYNIKVASRHYKPPELLVNMHDYDYSLDIWSLGCLFAGLILDRDPFFHGEDNDDQLVQISKVLGTDGLYEYLDKYGLELTEELQELIKPAPKKSWDIFIPFSNDDIAHPVAIDFLDKLLRYDPQERLTAQEAMNHPYFESFHKSK
ncbi:putative protein serine/threonine kinase [Cavenderia fasciculata]|uniref:non-specific serine/threonine protein kinase n=1 Tax=Cavenderia fasciculata TaxID=261658 RepID=F4Q738_CACFS|nr:putative protein serine/threonine kinase [Cavenderia fasciculata]EGG16220.1 putative protein serine/threonine kinase [Cavenderia fasciculata]|eukprot:XP_004354604.1 putative protein serine/threonine kinase [Cavenderia fasciculata]